MRPMNGQARVEEGPEEHLVTTEVFPTDVFRGKGAITFGCVFIGDLTRLPEIAPS